jgi:G3E family GTPase
MIYFSCWNIYIMEREKEYSMVTRLVLVGGFLGAGKTTLLREAARRLNQNGRRIGLITNDQTSELVDTALLGHGQATVEEVSGSCFCCNFPGLVEAITQLNADGPLETIFAEPVGSCTDLSATIIQPLKEKYADKVSVAPFSVLIDPRQLSDILDHRPTELHPSALYIIRKQLEEADIIVITKTDLLKPAELAELQKRAAEEWPWATVCCLSVKAGTGLEDWWTKVTEQTQAGRRLAKVDYDTYAEGEAVLGWLNATVELQGTVNWNDFAAELLHALSDRFEKMNATIGHLKLLVEAAGAFVTGSVTSQKGSLNLREAAGSGESARLTLNARVQMEPEQLEAVVREELKQVAAEKHASAKIAVLNCLKPGRPNPTYHYDRVVS